MKLPRPATLLSVLALAVLPAPSCRDAVAPAATPTPVFVARGGTLYKCENGVGGCSVTYIIGPVTSLAGKLRVHFQLTMEGPAGGTTRWTNDTTMHEFLEGQGQPGIMLTLGSDATVTYGLASVGGIAAADEMLVAPVTRFGFWEFVVDQPPGSLLWLTYPDFRQDPVPIVVPE